MKDEIALVEGFFGEKVSPDLIALVRKADYRQLHELREAQRDFEHSFSLPEKSPREYRPYVCTDALIFPELSHGFRVGETTRFYEPDEPETVFKAADILQKHLLYCHSIAVNSPLGFICDLFYETRPERFDAHRTNLANYIAFLIQVKPLVECGALTLIPSQRSRELSDVFRVYPPLLDENAHERIARSASFESLYRDVPATLVEDADFKNLYTRSAERSILMTLMEERAQGGALDLYMPHPYFRDVLDALIPALLERGLQGHAPLDAHRLRELVSVELPGLGNLRASDIAALRENEASFQEWRTALSRALDRLLSLQMDSLYADPARREVEAAAVLEDELQDRARALQHTVRSSSVLQRSAGPLRAFTLGSVGALATAALAAPDPALAAGAVTCAADLLLSFLMRGDSSASKALVRHYAVFDQLGASDGAARGAR